MRGLGETVAILGRAAREAAAAEPEIPPGGAGRLVETARFGSNPGGLKMLSYAPEGLPPGAPLVVVLHGCSQSGPGYAVRGGWIELADRLGFAVLAPEQTTSNNLNRCFNWFSTSDIERDRGEPASIAQMIHMAVRAYDLDPQRVFITGLSAGGAMSAVMLATYPELFAGGAIVAGLPFGVATNMHNALRVMRQADGRDRDALGELVRVAVREAEPATLRPDLRLAIWQGDADTTVDVANADDLAAQWTSVTGLEGAPQDRHRFTKATHARSLQKTSGPGLSIMLRRSNFAPQRSEYFATQHKPVEGSTLSAPYGSPPRGAPIRLIKSCGMGSYGADGRNGPASGPQHGVSPPG
jgi:poly(hydroxyalkanoate) depolymerase family esterase